MHCQQSFVDGVYQFLSNADVFRFDDKFATAMRKNETQRVVTGPKLTFDVGLHNGFGHALFLVQGAFQRGIAGAQ